MQVWGTGRYKAVDRDGMAAVGEVVSSGEILINKQSPTTTKDVPSEHGAPTYKPAPICYTELECLTDMCRCGGLDGTRL